MIKVNAADCELDEVLERGEFRCAASTLTGGSGPKWMGASVYEMQDGDKRGPYHYHHGIEEWMYVISGAPVHRDPSGERTLEPGDMVAFRSGPLGAHTVRGPGRVVIFSTGARGWGEAFVSVYLDSDKIAAAPGVMFRRGDAVDSWREETSKSSEQPQEPSSEASPVVAVLSLGVEPPRSDGSSRPHATKLGPLLGAEAWAATLFELAPGDATAPYHYEWCREEWVLVLAGKPTLRHADGKEVLAPLDILCFPEGPAGAHRFLNHGKETARLIIFSSPTGRPMSAFSPTTGRSSFASPATRGSCSVSMIRSPTTGTASRERACAGVAFSLLFTIAFVCARIVIPTDPGDAGTWLTDSTKRTAAVVGLTGGVVAIVMVLDGLHVEPWVVLAFPAWVLALSLSILVASFRRRRAGITVDSCLPPRPQQRQAAGARRTGPDRRG